MSRILSVVAFVLGLAVVVWVGAGYVGLSPLALGMTALIGLVYLTGAVELLRFDRATSALQHALDTIPVELPDPGGWLRGLPPSLQNAVRLRLEGERVGLPGPALTPYLVGLLVLLGMLGTFLGMVMTLNGAVIALETTTDLQTIRSSLAAPVKGLGVAFGTSVAGVAASAMLGLVSALSRRARLQASQLLDSRISHELRGFSLAQQRQEAFQAVQEQARTLPVLIETLQAMMAQMESQNRELHAQMATAQQRFYDEARGSYTALAASIDGSLKHSLSESARQAGQIIQPLVADTMAGIARETTALQQHVADGVQAQLETLMTRFDATATRVTDGWTDALARQERTGQATGQALQNALQVFADTFTQRSATLVDQVGVSVLALHAELSDQDAARQCEQSAALQSMAAALRSELQSMTTALRSEWQQMDALAVSRQQTLVDRFDETSRALAASTQEQAGQTIEQVAALMHTAAEAPRAAAEVISQLRHELSASIARDNAALDERNRIMETLRGLLDAINHASGEQRQAIDALVVSSASALARAAEGFEQRMASEATCLADTAGQVASGAVEVASLAEGFGLAVQLFRESNDKLMLSLQRIEGALEKSMTRSDEQLAYYVAQARELIDLSLMSQKQIVDDLQQLPGRAGAAGEG